MTTTVIVEANHGWPVDVTSKNAKTGENIGNPRRVEKNAKQSFSVFGGTDLLIHEVQPDEETEKPALTPNPAAVDPEDYKSDDPDATNTDPVKVIAP